MGMLEKIYEICPSGGILIWVEKISQSSTREKIISIIENDETLRILIRGVFYTAGK